MGISPRPSHKRCGRERVEQVTSLLDLRLQGISVFLPLAKSVKHDVGPHPTILSVL